MKIRVGALRGIIRRSIQENSVRDYVRTILLEFPEGKCPSCGKDNAKGKKFCTKCGTKLGKCPKCDAPLNDKPGQKFCTKCSEKLVMSERESDSTSDDGNQKIKKDVEQALSEAEKLLKELENALSNAPDRPSKEENRLHDEIMGAYYEEQDKLLEVDPETPQEAREHIKKVGDHMRQFKPTMIKFYKAVKGEGKVLSKPVIELLISSLKKEVEFEKKIAAQTAANEKRSADAKAEHEKKMAASAAEHEKKMAAIDAQMDDQRRTLQKMIDDAIKSTKK